MRFLHHFNVEQYIFSVLYNIIQLHLHITIQQNCSLFKTFLSQLAGTGFQGCFLTPPTRLLHPHSLTGHYTIGPLYGGPQPSSDQHLLHSQDKDSLSQNHDC